MVLLTLTPAARVAVEEYAKLKHDECGSNVDEKTITLSNTEISSPIAHHDLVDVSRFLVNKARPDELATRKWRLDVLLKGALVYQHPPPPKPEPTPEFKALMQRLREQEEQRQYERMINPASPAETFSQRFPNTASPSLGSGFNAGYNTADEVDDVTYADVNRQMILIINVLISIICTSVAVWMAARRWSVPERLGLAFTSSTVVAVAEVAIYMGYIRRIKEAKTKEKKKEEKKEVIDTWVIDGKPVSTSKQGELSDTIRFRKGKHR